MNRRAFLLGATALVTAKVLPPVGDGVALMSTAHPLADFTTDNLIVKATERYHINWASFKAIGVCDRCGGLWSIKSLTAMVSPRTRQTNLLVCRECIETGSTEISEWSSSIREEALEDVEIEISPVPLRSFYGSRGA